MTTNGQHDDAREESDLTDQTDPEPSQQEHHNSTTEEDTASGGAPER